MAENLPLPLSQADAVAIEAQVRECLDAVEQVWTERGGHDPRVIRRELEHVLRREAVARAPENLP